MTHIDGIHCSKTLLEIVCPLSTTPKMLDAALTPNPPSCHKPMGAHQSKATTEIYFVSI
jgi:hypothetical protein